MMPETHLKTTFPLSNELGAILFDEDGLLENFLHLFWDNRLGQIGTDWDRYG